MLRAADKQLHVHRPVSRAMPVTTASAVYCREVLRDTPRAFWPFQDRSGNPVDVSGNGLDMTSVSGSPVYRVAGPFGDDFSIQVPGGSSLNRSSQVSTVQNNFTIELWFMIEVITNTDQVLFHNGNAATNGWGIRVENGDTYRGLAGGVAEQTTRGYGQNQWTHLVVQRDGSDSNRWKYYQNGVVTLANAGTTNPGAPSGTVLMGAANLQTRYAYCAVYESVLSAARILAHFNASNLRGNP